jgi:DNA-binding protein HU-beta
VNKAELIDSISELSGLTKRESTNALDSLTKTITSELAKGGDIALVGFGRFHVADQAARVGRNPRTGEALEIPARKRVAFKAGLSLKSAL